jgi:hypothetical protein
MLVEKFALVLLYAGLTRISDASLKFSLNIKDFDVVTIDVVRDILHDFMVFSKWRRVLFNSIIA